MNLPKSGDINFTKIDILRWIKENKQIRLLVFPLARLLDLLRFCRYNNSKDSRYIKQLKDSHRGEKCFVIGNGPSLLQEDLDQLWKAGVPCFAANRIYRIYPMTKWRPTYYMCMDTYVAKSEIENIKAIGDYPKFINYKARVYGRKDNENIHYLCTEAKFTVDPYSLETSVFHKDVSKGVAKVATVTATAIELAIYMGFKTVYLLGCDSNYALKRMKDGTISFDPAMGSSYFKGMQEQQGKPRDDCMVVQNVDYMERSYKQCKEFASQNGVMVYNATRGGKLETFPRVNFDQLMTEGKTL